MVLNNRNGSVGSAGSKPSAPLSPKRAWDGLAHDYGWFNAAKQSKRDFRIMGMNDMHMFEDDLHALFKTDSVKLPASKAHADGKRAVRLRHEDRLRVNIPLFLALELPQARLSEPLQAVVELAGKRKPERASGSGLIDSYWADDADDGLAKVLEFLIELKGHYQGDKFHNVMVGRERQVQAEFQRQEQVVDFILAQYQQVHVVIVDFGVRMGAVFPGQSHCDLIEVTRRNLNCGASLLQAIHGDPMLGSDVCGYIHHVEIHQVAGPYVRGLYLLRPGDIGARERFLARLWRAWQYLGGGAAWMADCRKHPNRLVAGLGRVSVRDQSSLKRLRAAIEFGACKDLLMHVGPLQEATFLSGCVMQQPLNAIPARTSDQTFVRG